jgi:hypothetical protein
MVAVPYRPMRNVMIAAGVLYCSLLPEAVALQRASVLLICLFLATLLPRLRQAFLR